MTAHTKTDIRFIRVSKKIYEAGNTEYHQKRYSPDLSNLIIGPKLKASGLFNTFCSNFRNNQLNLPSLPNIALKLQREMRNDIGIAESAKIVQLDPAITARLIQVANSPIYLSAQPVKDCLTAVNRLGFNATRNLVISVSMKQSYNQISGDTFKARFPLASGKTYSVTAHTKTDIRFIRVSKKIYEAGNTEYHQKRYSPDLSNLIIGPKLKASGLFNTFCSNFRNNQLNLPSLPNIALKLQREMRNDIGIAESAKIVQLDPAITARLIQVANSPIYLSAQPVKHTV